MRTQTYTLQALVPNVVGSEDLELIMMPVETGFDIFLLHSKSMPGFAFMMWDDLITSTYSQMVLIGKNGNRSVKFAVVCACCPSETYGVERPEGTEEELRTWKEQLAAMFGAALRGVCAANGIHTIFMRRADSFGRHYGDNHGLRIVEVEDHAATLHPFYPADYVERRLSFIDYRSSRGFGCGW